MATMTLDREHVFDDALMDREVRVGLPVELFFRLRDALAVQQETLSNVISVPIRTLMRRKQLGERLKSDESERLLRLARLHIRAVEVLNGVEKARRWLFSANRALGGKTPFEFASTQKRIVYEPTARFVRTTVNVGAAAVPAVVTSLTAAAFAPYTSVRSGASVASAVAEN